MRAGIVKRLPEPALAGTHLPYVVGLTPLLHAPRAGDVIADPQVHFWAERQAHPLNPRLPRHFSRANIESRLPTRGRRSQSASELESIGDLQSHGRHVVAKRCFEPSLRATGTRRSGRSRRDVAIALAECFAEASRSNSEVHPGRVSASADGP